MNKKTIISIAVASLGICAASGASLSLTSLSPATTAITGTASSGTLTTLSGTLVEALGSTVGLVTFSLQLTGVTADELTGDTVTFDLSMIASAGDGISVNQQNWVVDKLGDGLHSTDIDTSSGGARVDSDETIQFSLSNAKINGGAATLSNISFSNPLTNNANTGGSISTAGLFTTTGGVRLKDIDVSFDVVTVPEPSSSALLGLGGLALILRRRK